MPDVRPLVAWRHALLLSALLTSPLCFAGCGKEQPPRPYPARPIKVVVPFGAGGGTDTFTRIIANAIEEEGLLPEKLVIINLDGAGTTIGSRRVKNALPDGYTVLMLHEALVTAKYAGTVAYGPEAFLPIAGTGENSLVLAVRDDSPYADLAALMRAAVDEPDTVVYGAYLGTPSHFAGLLVEHAVPEAKFRFMQTGGGAKRLHALLGGHIDLTLFSAAEYVSFKPAGIRAIAVLSDERQSFDPSVATAKEQGVPISNRVLQCWWAPLGTPPDRVKRFGDAVEAAIQLPAVRERLAELYVEPVVLRGEPLEAHWQRVSREIAAVDLRQPNSLPNVPLWIGGAIVLLTLLLGGQQIRRARRPAVALQYRLRPRLAAVTFGLTLAYAGLLASGWVDLRLLTWGFIMVAGLLLAQERLRTLPWLVGMATILAFGLHYIFTQVMQIDLP